MASCFQYSSNYVDADDIDLSTADIDLGFIKDIINKDNSDYIDPDPTKVTGVWYPIVIKQSDNEALYCDLLHKSKLNSKYINKYYENIYGKDSCQSLDVGSFNILDISDNLVAARSRFFDGEDAEYIHNSLDCSYCGTHTQTWKLIDDQGNESEEYEADCCGGACDVRMNEDDYIPKMPLLNHHYYSEPCDFKYINDNPARSGPGLGKEACIKFSTVDGLTFTGDIELCIDWKLKETISEIEYDENITQHANKLLHNKSYKKSQITSKTCGNFIFTSINEDTKYSDYSYSWLEDNLGDPPKPEQFTSPYGMYGNSTDNIFVGSEKIGSFWKWNYTSGILGWYRKYDVNRHNDQRPISGYDLYIAPGDVFFATNAKIEPDPPAPTPATPSPPPSQNPQNQFTIKSCPSGLKIVQDGSNFRGIIPNESNFMYISSNIYDLFYEWYERYLEAGSSSAMTLAAIMATAPQFENVTTDLLDDTYYSNFNDLEQVESLSKDLQTGTDYWSNRIFYVDNDNDLKDVLIYKYGAYLSIKNNSSIEFDSSVSDNFVLDMNFDFVTKKDNANASYSQKIKAGQDVFLETKASSLTINEIYYNSPTNYSLYDIYPRIVDSSTHDTDNQTYCDDCDAYSSFYLTDDGEAACIEDGNASFCYDTLAFFLNNSQGEEEGTRPQRNISDATLREARSTFKHPYIDTFAINSKKSMYVSSAMYDIPIGVTHRNSKKCKTNSKLQLSFTVDSNSMIKLYWSTLKQVQNDQCKSNERFPLDFNNLCTCYENNSYVPNLSTSIGPELKKYGGFSQASLDSMFGAGVLSAGSLSSISYRTDPFFMHDCVDSVSVSIPNYVHDEWDLEIFNWGGGLVYVDEDINTNISPWKLVEDPNNTPPTYGGELAQTEFWYEPRPEWKRFATKVTIEENGNSDNTLSLYSDQFRYLFDADKYILKLDNPFLTGLIHDEAYITGISPSLSINCTNYNDPTSGLTDIRGDELSTINLTFSNKSEKQLLSFYFHEAGPTGLIDEAQFHPNKGLKAEETLFNPIVSNSHFDYNATQANKNNDCEIFYGNINNDFINTFSNLIDFKINRKVKLYVKQNKKWLNVGLMNYGDGFFNHLGYKFPGNPSVFEYLSSPKSTKGIPYVLPSVSKTKHWFHAKVQRSNYSQIDDTAPVYPLLNYKDLAVVNTNTIRFKGSRYYFQVPNEKLRARLYNGNDTIVSLNDIDGQTEFIDTNGNREKDFLDLSYPRYLIELGNNYYKFLGGNKTDKTRYVKIDIEDEVLLTPHNDTQLDLSNGNLSGKVQNSTADCDHTVDILCQSGRLGIKKIQNIIKKKYLKWFHYDKDNFKTSAALAVKSELYTYFEFDTDLPANEKIFALDMHPNTSQSFSLLVYNDTESTDNSIYLNNSFLHTKWDDVASYDGSLLEEFFNDKELLISDILHSPPYNNWFYKHFINFLVSSIDERIYISDTYGNQETVYNSDLLGTVLQKYNLSDPNLNAKNIKSSDILNHQNFIPIMDICIQSALPNIVQSSLTAGINDFKFSTSSLLSPYVDTANDYILPSNQFWVIIMDDNSPVTSYIPEYKYHKTLRVDGPFNCLHKTTFTKSYDSTQTGFRKKFPPSISTIQQSKNIGTIKHHDNAFMTFSIYGDKDKPKCEAQLNEDRRGLCILPEIGTGFLKAQTAYDLTTGETSSITSRSDVKYWFSYDCGEYHPLNTNQLVEIKRSVLGYDSYTMPVDHSNKTYFKPSNELPNIVDKKYQDEIDTLSKTRNTQDDHANEMLFRILYGETDKEYVNKEFFAYSQVEPLTQIDLIDYSDPEITPRDLYDQILFNYDKDANFSNFIFDATISDNALLDTNFEYILKINNQELKIKIEDINSDIEATASFKGEDYSVILFNKQRTNYGYISVEAGEPAPSAPNNNTTITKTKTIEYLPARMIAPVGKRYRTGDVAIKSSVGYYKKGMVINCGDIDPSIINGRQFNAWDNNYEIVGSPFQNRSYSLEGNKTRNINYDNVSSVSINNLLGLGLAFGMQGDLNLVPGPWRWSTITDTEPASTPEGPDFTYGYCRRTLNCSEPKPADPSNSIKENFEYEYEIGNYKFDLFGHIYLHTPFPSTNNSNSSSSVCFDSTMQLAAGRCYEVNLGNAVAGSTPYGDVYYSIQSTRPAGESEYGIDGPLDGIDVRGDFRYCYEPRDGMDLEPECVPFSDNTKWGLGYAIWKPRVGFYLPYGEAWATGMLHLQTMDSSTDDFWDYWQEIDGYKESSNPYHFSNSICADDNSLNFFKSMEYSPVIIGDYGLTQEIKQDLLNQFNNYEYPIAEWLVNNGTTEADQGLAMNYGDEGVDYCGYVDEQVTIPDVDLYMKEETVYDTYEPGNGIDIRITQNEITVTIQGQTICIANILYRCPKIELPQNNNSIYTINDSGCNKCSNSQLKIDLSQKSTYKTITETRKHYLASMNGTDLNDAFHDIHFVGNVNQNYPPNRFRYYDIGDGWFDVVCGESPGNPWYSHRYIMERDGMGTFDRQASIWKQNITNLFNEDDYADTQVVDKGLARRDPISNLGSTILDIARVRRTDRANSNIVESDIIHGVVPGSVSNFKITVQDQDYTKFRRSGNSVQTDIGKFKTYTASVTYKYVRPYTLKDAIKESKLGVTDDSFVNQAFDLDFPLWYGQWMGLSAANEIILNRPSTRNFIVVQKVLSFQNDEDTGCQNFECDYDKNSIPCPALDHYCWSISSWNGVR